jgi:alanine-synthesizing transaminase
MCFAISLAAAIRVSGIGGRHSLRKQRAEEFLPGREPRAHHRAHPLHHGEEARRAPEYQMRRDVMVDHLNRQGWQVTKPKGGMFVWTPIPEPWRSRMGSIDFAMKLLEEAEVAVSPGRGFGETGEGHLRLALVENEHRLRQAVRQIGRCLKPEKAIT